MHSIHVFYSGIVQGVGFRYTVQRYADSLGLCGYARNLPDGRVEMRAEGSQANVKTLLDNIQKRFEGSIREVELYEEPQVQGFINFEIRF